MDSEGLRQAGQLIEFGLHPRLFPGQDREYKDLLSRYRLDLEFQEAVDAVAEGMKLVVAAATELGFFLTALPGSVFAYTLADFRRDRGTQASYDDRILHGLGMVAIVAHYYPAARDLEAEHHKPATALEVDHFLAATCEDLKRQAESADFNADQPELELMWQLYLRQPEAVGTPDGRRAQRGRVAILDRCFAILAEQGLVRATRDTDTPNAAYEPLERMRMQVANVAGNVAYQTLAKLRRQQLECEEARA